LPSGRCTSAAPAAYPALQDGVFTRHEHAGYGTVFGIWGTTPTTCGRVGGRPAAAGSLRLAARNTARTARQWLPAPGFSPDLARSDALWKVYGHGADDVWMVGTGGKALHWDGVRLTPSFTGLAIMFTVHANSTTLPPWAASSAACSWSARFRAADAPWLDRAPRARRRWSACASPKREVMRSVSRLHRQRDATAGTKRIPA
jgi:hypothetical protein